MKTARDYQSARCYWEPFTKSKIRPVCAVLLAVICAGCGGETNRKLLQRYEPQFNEKRAQFKKIAAILPAPGSVKQASPAKLSPAPIYDDKNTAKNNTEIVMYDQLLDPDIGSESNRRLDLLLHGNLLTGMQWTGPKNPMSSNVLDKHSPDLEQTLTQGLSERYLVVLRPVNFVAPIATDESTFKPGMADMEGFIVDLPARNIAGSFPFTAHSASTVEYSSNKGDSSSTRQSRLEEFAYSSLYVDARTKLKPLLEQNTGGRFTLGQ